MCRHPPESATLICRAAKLSATSLEAAAGQMLLGKVLLRQGDAPAAEAAFRLCLATREERLGLQHPDTALALLGGPHSSITPPGLNVTLCLLHTLQCLATYTLVNLRYQTQMQAFSEFRGRLQMNYNQSIVCCTGMASALDAEQKAGQASALVHRATGVLRKTLGVQHPLTLSATAQLIPKS